MRCDARVRKSYGQAHGVVSGGSGVQAVQGGKTAEKPGSDGNPSPLSLSVSFLGDHGPACLT